MPVSLNGYIRADGDRDVTQSQVVLEVEWRARERFSTTMEAGEGEENKYASILTSTSGIRPPTVEKPVHYNQIDLDATKVNQFTYTYVRTVHIHYQFSSVAYVHGDEAMTSMYTCLFFSPPLAKGSPIWSHV